MCPPLRAQHAISPLAKLLIISISLQLIKGLDAIYDTQGPSFVSEPPARAEFTSTSGGRVDCVGRGNPSPSVEWLTADHGGITSIPRVRLILSNGSLLFPPFDAEAFRQDVHWAVYRCVVSNSVGAIVSRDVTIRAVVNQRYQPEVQSPGGFLGNNVIIRCNVPSFVREHVRVTSWLQEPSLNIYPTTVSDGKYHMLPSGELMILNISRADSTKTYRCRTHHQLSQEAVTSPNAGRIQLTDIRDKLVPPILNEKRVTESAKLDETVVIPCVAYANPRPHYSWSYRLNLHESTQDASARHIVHDGTLVIANIQESDAGIYYCNASNTEGSEVLEVHLSVTAPLQVHLHPVRQSVDLGKSAELTCGATGFPQSSVTWLKDGRPLRIGARIRMLDERRIQLVSVMKEDRGMYQCVVRNEAEMAQASAEISLGEVYPQLAYKFIEQTLQPGPSVSLKCSASGNPTPQISWTLDGFLLPHSERLMIGQYVTPFGDVISHVNISTVKVEDGGEYECTAENRAGSASHAARLNVYGLPYVRPMPLISSVAGKQLSVKCPVAGYPIDQVNWEKDGVRLPSNIRQRVTNGSLTIDNVQRSADQGTYTCWARNKQNHTSQRAVEIRVLVPPKITPFKFAQDLNVGDRTSIQCVVVTGDIPLTFSWLKDSMNALQINNNNNINNINNNNNNNNNNNYINNNITIRQYDDFTSALSIISIDRVHAGNYTCRVSNNAAAVTHTTQLRVNVPPRLSPFYFEEGVTEGMRTQIMCTASQGDRPFNITWRKDSTLLGQANNAWVNIGEYAPFSSILTINSVTSSHSGNYTCVVANNAGKAEYTAHLFVAVPPRWTVEPNDQSAVLGNAILLDCQADGFPNPITNWKQAVGSEPGDYRELGAHSQHVQHLANGSLAIPAVTLEHDGYYLCQAGNGIGPGLSKVIKLTVHAGPRFKSRLKQETARKGEFVHLSCEAEGDSPMTITWRFQGNRIHDQDSGYHTRYLVKTVLSSGSGAKSELSIADPTPSDGGEYTCVASNAFGQDQSIIGLVVQEPPGFPRNLHVAEHSSRSLLLAWAANTGAIITSYHLQYKEASDLWHEHNSQLSISGGVQAVLVPDLRPSTTYHFRLFAENELGRSAASDVLQGATDMEPPGGPPLHVVVEAITSQQIRLTWQPPEPELRHGDLLGYNVGYRKIGDEHESYNWTVVTAVGSDLPSDLRLTGLSKFTPYSVVVQAFNAKGEGPTSEPTTTSTLEDVPSGPPRALTCAALTPSSLQISWQVPALHQTHGLVQGYKLVYEPSEDWYDAVELESKITTSLTTVLHGLKPFTNYSLQILAFTRMGDGVSSAPVYCKTEEAVPDAPESIKSIVSGSDSAILSWLPPRRPHGIITKYTVYVRKLELEREVKVDKTILSPLQLHYELNRLENVYEYEVWVVASSKAGPGAGTQPFRLKFGGTSVPASIVSFGRIVVVPWKVEVKLACLCIGVPRPTTEWRVGDARIRNLRMSQTPDNTLVIQSVQRNNEGNYTCHARNSLGSDFIMYTLQVQVPPIAPLLLATAATHQSVQLQWKQGDNGGSVVRGFLLSYRVESDSNDWQKVTIDRRATTYLLDNLLCGTSYQFELAALNKIGIGVSSKRETAVTKGGKPGHPPKGRILRVNTTSATFVSSVWPDGGCPIQNIIVEYQMVGSHDWIVAKDGTSGHLQKDVTLVGLTAGKRYALRVAAYNSAGSTLAEFDFTTLGGISEVSSDIGPDLPVYLDTHILAPALISLVALVLALAGVCFCLRMKSDADNVITHETQTAEEAMMENKQNLQQREQYYATVRKSHIHGLESPQGLERIPEYSEDIYPYATFHLENPRPLSSQGNQCDGKRSRGHHKVKNLKSESEEYDTLGSDSDTEHGTSSRTESSNHLDHSAGPIHHNFLRRMHESSTSTEPSPICERKSFPRTRHNKLRGNGGCINRKVPTAFVLGRKLEPPTGFSDGRELSEAECDIDSTRKLRLFAMASANQDFTIAV